MLRLIANIRSPAVFTADNHRCSLRGCVFLVLISWRNLVLVLFCGISVPQVTRCPVLFRADLDLGCLFNMLGVDVFCGLRVTRSARVVVVP